LRFARRPVHPTGSSQELGIYHRQTKRAPTKPYASQIVRPRGYSFERASAPQTALASLHRPALGACPSCHRAALSPLFAMLRLQVSSGQPASYEVPSSQCRNRRLTVCPVANPMGDDAAICQQRYMATTGARPPKGARNLE